MVINSSKDVGEEKFLLMKYSQALGNWIKKSSLFYFCKFVSLLDLMIRFCLENARSWLEFRIKFNRYSMRSFQRALVQFINHWIHFSFRDFNWMSMSEIPSLPLKKEQFELGNWEIVCFCNFFFNIFWNSIYFTYITQFE